MTTPILLIHGLMGCLNDPAILAPFSAISAHTPVLAPDLLGYGAFRTADTGNLRLEAQADHVAQWLHQKSAELVHVVGHSSGGAVTLVLAHRYPERVCSLTSVEGNFTLQDAFWSSQLARKPVEEIDAMLDAYKAQVDSWLADVGVTPTAWRRDLALRWLNHQPGSTLKAQSCALVEATSRPAYLDMVRSLLDSGLPLHLIGGARSRGDWGVPPWVVTRAASNTDIAGAGHLMMMEEPEQFAAVVLGNIGSNRL